MCYILSPDSILDQNSVFLVVSVRPLQWTLFKEEGKGVEMFPLLSPEQLDFKPIEYPR